MPLQQPKTYLSTGKLDDLFLFVPMTPNDFHGTDKYQKHQPRNHVYQ